MNKIYGLKWRADVGAFVVVPETARTVSVKRSPRDGSPLAAALAVALAGLQQMLNGLKPLWAALVTAGLSQAYAAPPLPAQLPTGGKVSAGAASISQAGNVMTVTQGSQRAAVNWQSFDVGSQGTVNFVQPSSSSVILNRVLGGAPSQIFGQINSNGQVILSNPSGILFSPSATLNVGALTATTHSLSDSNLMAGKLAFERNGSQASVVNEGQITTALGGYVALLAPEVRNSGVILAQMGTVALASGEWIELQFDERSKLANLMVTPSAVQALVDNRQAVQAPGGLIILSAQAASRLQGGVVRNSGTLEAKGIVNDGGVIRITASDRIVHSGRISADAASSPTAPAVGNGGTVTLIADLSNPNSVTEVSGSISAQGGAAGGRGGFVDTSASRLDIAEGALVNTSAPQGEAGTWLLDPYNVTIAASGASGTTYNNNFTAGSDSVIQASSIISALNAGSNVTIDTGAAGSPGASAGNITVSAAITRTSGGRPTLTLNAANQIDISANMGSNGVGLDLVLNAGGGAGVFSGVFAGTGSLTKQGAGTVILAGNNPYTGGTNISGGTLQIGNGGASGSVTGNITNNAALAFNRSNALTYAGVISGSGTVAQTGAGAITLSGNNSYNGTTTVSTGQLILSGANTGTGAITISTGTLQIGSGSTSGSLSAASITNNAALVFSRSDALSYSGAISGTGSLSSSGGGTVTLSGTNSYSGTTTVSGGTLVLSGSNTGVGMITVNTTRQLKIGDGGASGSVAADITNNGTVVFNRTDALTYSGAISGTGGLTQSGTGTTKLTGSNTYTGGTTISAGTLQIGDAGTSGSLTGRIVNNAALVFNRSDVTYTYGGVISGAGTVSQSGTGMVTLTGENTGTGTITIQNGTLQIGNGGTTGSVAASITNNASLFFNRSNTVTYSGVISGSGTLRQYGSGTLALSGNNTYTGVTTIYFGKLLVGNGSTSGSLTGDIVNRAALEFSRSDAHSYGGIISGAGSLTQSGAGALTLSGNNSYSGTSLVSNGTLILSGSNTGVGVITVNSRTQLSIGNGGASGSVAADITNGGTVVFNRTDAVTYSGAISGTGVLTQSGSGTTKLTGSNTFSGTTTISGGTLQIGDAGASGSLTSNITNNAALVFNRSDVTYTYGGVISGSGTLTQSGAGTVTLSGANLYTGSTAVSAGQLSLTGANAGTGAITISGGTLQVGAGDTTGSISATSITNNGALVFNRSDALLSYAGIISGSGSLTKSGTGTVTLSGSNSYSGATTVSGGTLNLSGSNNGLGTFTVNTGARLKVSSASGSVAANITNNGGVEFSRSTDWSYASAISGTGTLTHSGAGTTTLSGNNSYAGTTTVGAGQLTLTGDNTGSGAFTISGGTLQVGAGGTSGSLSATSITTNAANTALVFSRSNAYTYAGIISGAGSLTKSGTGTVTLSANNTYSGATTVSAGQLTLTGNNSGTGAVTISAGTLQLGTGGTSGSISAASVTNNGALVFSRSDALYTYDGSITGMGSVTKSGAGTVTLSRNNRYSGGTTISAGQLILTGENTGAGAITINAGTLQVGSGGTSGSISAASITNNGALVFNRSTLLTYAGVISGTGTVAQTGEGATTLSGNNSYSGTTTVSAGQLTLSGTSSGTGTITISGGTLWVGDGNTSGSISAASITNNAALVFSRSDALLTYSGAISGTGSLSNRGNGTLTLSGNNSYAGTTLVSNGTLVLSGSNTGAGVITVSSSTQLKIGDGGASGSVAADITNGGTVVFNRTDALTYSGAMSGTGTLTQSGSGTTKLTGSNTYSGTTTISGGTLQIGDAGASGSLTSNITNNAALVFNRSDALTYAGIISGTGSLSQSGAGNTTLSGANLYTGSTAVSAGQLTLTGANAGTGAINISGGTLQVGTGDTTGSISAASITNNGALVLNRSGEGLLGLSYAGIISGTGSLTSSGTGTVTLSADNTYSGATTVSGGTLDLSGSNSGLGTITVNSGALLKVSGTSGSVAANITDNGAVVFSRSTAWTFGGAISGAGTLTQSGAGTTSLAGANTLTGGTTIIAGTLQVGSGGSSGSLAGNVLNSATLAFNRVDTAIFGGVISGAGQLTQVGLGTTKLIGDNTYTGRTTISAGTLQVGDGGTSGSIIGNVINNSALVFNRSAASLAYTFSGVISGSGSVTQSGAGTTVLTGDNTYTGGTTISAGTLELGGAGSTDSVLGNITNNAALVFNRSAPSVSTLSGVISGSGNVTQRGTGTTILTGDNTYTGLTTISSGTLQLGSVTTSGAIAGNIANSGALVINRSNDWTYSGVISGAGTVTQNGTGSITLTGDSTGTGTITVNRGKLQIGNAGTTGVLVSNIALNNLGVLVFNRSNDWTYSGTIGGTGYLEQKGLGATTLTGDNTRVGLTTVNAGQLILAGNNDRAGGFTVNGGTLKIGAGAAAGSLTAAITNDSAVVFNRSDSYTHSGIISGSGRLIQGGTGTTKLTGTSTYTGGTLISAGTLQIGDGGSRGIITGNITNNAALVFNRSDTLAVFNGVISGTGSVTQSGTGRATLANANTYTGGTTISAGTLQLGNAAENGSVLGDITNNAALEFSSSGTLTYGGVISGSGTLAQSGTGTTILTGANTFSGGTSVTTTGMLQIGDGGSSGSVAGDISVGGKAQLVFNRSDALNFAGVLSGSGRLVLSGAATITLTGKNTFIGSTAVNSGTLLIAGTSNLGTPSAGVYTYIGNIDIGGGATFNYGSLTTDTQKFTGLITGGGRFVKSGTSILEVNSNVGQMGHGGGTTVDSGTLQLNGGFAGNLTNNARLVLNGGTLSGVVSGAGTVVFGGSSSILDNAQTYTGGTTIAGGNTITLKAGGAFPAFTDLTIEEGGTLVVKANATFRSLAGGGVINYPGVIGETVTLTVGGGMASTDISTFSGNIGKNGTNGTFVFKKDGSGTQILTGNFNLGNSIHILQGTLQVGNGGTSGTIPALKSSPVGGEDTATTDNVNCGVRISCVIVNNGVLAINRSDDVDFSGAMSGTGGLLKAGAGNLNLKSAAWARPVSLNSFTGGTTITGGTLTIAATGALGVGGPLTITGGTLATTRYDWFNDWTGQSQGPRNYDVDASTVTITGGLITGSGAVRASGGFTITTNTDMTIVGNLSGAGGLTKAGTGTLTLSGFNSYSGNTLVSAGILKAANLAFGQGTVTVSDGAAVDINGYSLENNYVLSGTGVASSGALFNSSTGKAMLYGGLVLRSDTLIKTIGDLTIDNSVESVAAGYFGLSIINTGKVEITRNIGRPGERWQDTTRLGYLEVSGNVAIGGNIKTDGPLSFNGQVELYADNLTLSSEYGGVRAAQGFRSALQETRIVQFTGGNQYIYNGTTYTIGAVGAPLTGSLFASPVAGNFDSGSNTWAPGYTAYSWVAPTTTTAQLLVVAGGGAGGWHSDIKDIGGGGGGGVGFVPFVSLRSGSTYNIQVGNGGSPNRILSTPQGAAEPFSGVFGRGADSSFVGPSASSATQVLTTYGGGPGGYKSTDNGLLGGSGGGGHFGFFGSGGRAKVGTVFNMTGYTLLGSEGGRSASGNGWAGGGGGGARSNGSVGLEDGTGGNGGEGYLSAITQSAVVYGSGGAANGLKGPGLPGTNGGAVVPFTPTDLTNGDLSLRTIKLTDPNSAPTNLKDAYITAAGYALQSGKPNTGAGGAAGDSAKPYTSDLSQGNMNYGIAGQFAGAGGSGVVILRFKQPVSGTANVIVDPGIGRYEEPSDGGGEVTPIVVPTTEPKQVYVRMSGPVSSSSVYGTAPSYVPVLYTTADATVEAPFPRPPIVANAGGVIVAVARPTVAPSIVAAAVAASTTPDTPVPGGLTESSTPGSYTVAYTSGYSTSSQYTLAATVPGPWTVSSRPLTITAVADTKTYDRTYASSATPTLSVSGLAAGDAINALSQSFADWNAGTGKTLNVNSGYDIKNASNTSVLSNYSITLVSNTSGVITPADLSVTGLTASSKSFDGNATATLGGAAAISPISGDSVILGGTAAGSFANATIGKVKPVTVTGLTISGAQAGNYKLIQPTGLSADINGIILTITGLSANNKVYDGLLGATLSGTALLDGLPPGGDPNVSLSGSAVGSFLTANWGTGKPVKVEGFSLSGSTADSYTLVLPSGLTANIDKKALTITGITASNRAYDGTNVATIVTTAALMSGLVDVDKNDASRFSLSATGSFADKNASTTGKTVTLVSSYSGSAKDNYTITDQTSTTANITPANLTISTSNVTKTYDGGLSALGTAVKSAGLTTVTGDTLSGGTFAFTDKDAGTGKTVTTTGVTVNDGNGGNNYSITYADNTTSTIEKASLSLSGTRVYDGSKVFAGSNLSAAGINGESFVVSGAGDDSNLSSKNVQTGSTLASVTGLTLGTGNSAAALAGNYNALSTAGSSVAVTAASLTISTSNVTKTYDGGLSALGTAVKSGGLTTVTGDTLSGGTFAFTNKDAGTGKTVTTTGVTVNDGNGGANYSITYADNTTSTIEKASLSLSGTRVYDGSKVFAGSNLSAAGVNGETFAVTGAGDESNLSSKNVQAGSTLASVTGLALGTGNAAAALAGNYNALSTAGSSVAVTAASLTISTSNVTKPYDGDLSASGAAVKSGGLTTVTGDTLSGGTFAFTNKDAGTGKTVTTTGVTVNDGNSGNNYIITYANNTTSTIEQAALTITGATSATPSLTVYDGTLKTNTFTVTGAQGSEETSIRSAIVGSASFTDAGTKLDALGAAPIAAILGNYSVSYVNGSLTIGQKSATLKGNTSSKEYNGVSQTSGWAFGTEVLEADKSAITVAGAASATHVREGVKTDAFSVSGAKAGNYSFTFTPGSIQITPKTLTVDGQTTTATYDRTGKTNAAATVTGLALAADLTSITGYGAGTNRGTYADNLVVTLADPQNYKLEVKNGELTINPAKVTISGITAKDKVYNGTTDAELITGTVNRTGVIGGDDVSVNVGTLSGSFADKNVDIAGNVVTSKTVTISGISLTGAQANNYELSGGTTTTTTAKITPAPLSITGRTTTTTYNAEKQTNAEAAKVGLVGGESVTVTGNAEGTNASTTPYSDVLVATADTGTILSNYDISYTNGSLTINKAALTITADTKDKFYGKADPTLTFSNSGRKGSDTLASIGLSSGVTLTRAAGENATLVAGLDTPLAITAAGPASTTNYNITYVAGNFSIVPADVLRVKMDTTTTTYGTAGVHKAVSVSYLPSSSVTGDQVDMTGSNGGLTWTDSTSTINLAPALASVTGVNGLLTNVGSYPLAVTATSSGSTSNFKDVFVNAGTLKVDPAALTINMANDRRTYDATAYTGSASLASATGLKNGETLAGLGGVTLGGAAIGSVNRGSYAITGSAGAGLSNYTVTFNPGTLTTDRAALTLAGRNTTTTYNATEQSNRAPTITGWQGSDATSGTVAVTGLAKGTRAGNYTDSFALTGERSDNYVVSVTSTPGTLTINKAPLTVTGADNRNAYTGALQTNSGARYSGEQGSDTVSVSGYAQATNVAQGAVSDNLSVTLANPGDYEVNITQGSLTITPVTVTVSGRNTTATYTALAQTNTYATSGFVGGDAPTVTGMASGTDVRRNGAGSVIAYNDAALTVTLPSTNYELGTVTSGSLTINPAPLTVAGQNTTVTYNAAVQSNAAPTVVGVLGTDTAAGLVSVNGAASGTRKGTYSDSYTLSGSRSANYEISTSSTAGELVIDPKLLTISGITASDRVYDTTTAATVNATGALKTGLIGTDNVTVSATGSFADKNASPTPKTVTLASSYGGADKDNYTIIDQASTTAKISQAGLTVTGLSAESKTYDGLRDAKILGTAALSGVFAVDVPKVSLSATATATGSFADKNASPDLKAVTVTGLSLSGDESRNYILSQPSGLTANINKADLTISTRNVTKTYDGGTSALGTAFKSGGLTTVTGDTVSGGTFAFTNKDAGTGNKTVTTTGVTVTDDNSGGNYNITYADNTTSTINKAGLTITAATPASIVYDGALKTNTYSVAGAQGAEEASIRSAIIGSASRTDLGTTRDDLRPAASAAVLDNYSVTYNNQSLTITAMLATLTGNVSTKVYDGTLQTSGYVFGGVLEADISAISVAGAASATHVAEGVKNDAFIVSGAKAANYSFTYSPGSIQITPRTLTVDGQRTAVTYDKTDKTNAAATVTGLIAGDLLSPITGYGAGRNRGAYADNLVVSLKDAQNYGLTVTNGALTVNPATVTISGITASDKVYDGTTTAALSAASVSRTGVIDGDSVSVNVGTLSGSFADRNVDIVDSVVRSKAVAISGITLTGTDANNYQLSGGTTATTTAKITPKPLSITGNTTTASYNAETQTNAAASVTGLVSGESVTVTGLAQGKNAGTYQDVLVVAAADTETLLSNYAVSYTPGQLQIDKAALTIVADNAVKVFGNPDPTLTATDSGLLGTDTMASTGLSIGVTLTRAAGENPTLTFIGATSTNSPLAITAAGPASTANYNITYLPGNFTIVAGNTLVVGMNRTVTTYGTAGVHSALSAYYVPSATGVQVNMTGSNGGLTWTDGTSTINLAPALASVPGVNGLLTNVGSYSLAVTAAASGSTGNFSSIFVNAGTLQVDPANLTINIANDRRTYNAAPYAANPALVSATGLKNGQTLSGLGGVTLGGGAIGSVNAGSYAITGSAGAGLSNYAVTVNPGTLTTDKAALTLAGSNTVTTYKATAQTNVAPTITGWQGSDETSGTVAVTGLATGTRAGSYTDSFALSGERADNYEISIGSTPGTLQINKAALTVKGSDNRNAYTGALQTNTGASISGLQGSDTASVSGYAQAARVAQGKVSDELNLTLANPGDYEVSTTQGSLSITPVTVTVSGRNTTSTYTAFSQTNSYTTSGLVGMDALTVTGMASATDVRRNASGSVMAYADSLRVTLPSSDYLLGTVSDGSLTINPAPLTLAGQKTSVTYNASRQVNGGPALRGLLGADTAASAVYATGLGAGTRAGSYADSYALTGARSGNYEISKDSTTGELVIKPKDLTVTGAKDTSKVYNGTTQTNSDAKVSGLQGDDRVTVTGYATARNVGDGVKSDTLKLELVNPGDYNVSYTNGSLAITPYLLSATGGSSTSPGLTSRANDKVYDGNTTASGTVAPVLFAGDSLTASASSANFDTKDAGSGKTVTLSGLSLGGNATTMANYSLPASSTATAEIKKRPLGITGATTTQAYNAATQSNAAAKVEAMVSGESVTVSGYGQGRNVGNYADALVAAAGAGTSLSNYDVSYTNGALTITPASRKPADPAPLVLPLTAASAAAVVSRGSPIVSVLVVRQTSTEIGGIVVVYVPKELATSGQGFTFRFPDSLFPSSVDGAQADASSAAARATLTNGDPLPRWLSFDPVTKVISASAVPDRSFPIEVLITDGEKVITVVVSERAAGN